MIIRYAFLLILFITIALKGWGQTVVISDDSTNISGSASSVLELKSNNKGFLAPRMTQGQRSAITSPVAGLLIYQTDGVAGYYYYSGSAWTRLANDAVSSQWITKDTNVYYTGGNVGIGIDTPRQALDIKGNLKFSGSIMPGNNPGTLGHVLTSGGASGTPTWTDPASYLTSGWQLGGNTVATPQKFGTLSYQDLPFVTNNVEKMRILADGKIGIGKIAPTEILDVVGNVRFSGALMPNNLPGAAGQFLMSAGASTVPTWGDAWKPGGNNITSGSTAIGTTNFADLTLMTNNTTKVTVKSDGKVGIANAAPAEMLDVTGNVRLSGALMPAGSAGLAGYFLTSAGTNAAPTWTDPATLAWKPGGNTFTGINNFGTASYHDLPIITANIEKMRVKADGKVGIGTATPAELLDVAGNVNVTGNVNFTGALMPGGSSGTSGFFLTSAGASTAPTWTDPATLAWKPGGNTFTGVTNFGTLSYHDLPFITANAEKMRILADGKVGIGKTAPTEILDVVGNVRFSGAIMPNNLPGAAGQFLTSAGAGASPIWSDAWKPGGNNITSGSTAIGTTNYADLLLMTNNTTKVTVKADGKVGIANAAPAEMLDVTGNVRMSGALMPGGSAGTSGFFLTSAGANTAPTWTDPSTLAWKPGGNTFTGVNSFGTLSYHDLPFVTGNSEKMRILADGKIGIGKTAPTEILDVVGNVRFSGALMPNNAPGAAGQFLMSAGASTVPTWGDAWKPGGNNITSLSTFGTTSYIDLPFVTANIEKMRILADGKVGIGKTAPTEILDVVGNVRISGAFMPNNLPGSAGQFLTSAGAGAAPTWGDAWKPGGNNITSGSTAIGTTNFADLSLMANNATRVTVKADGKVGIANTSPSEILDVTGNIEFSGALMPGNSAGTSGYLLTSAGTNTAPTWTNPATTLWRTGGNALGAVSNLGTTSSHDLPIITANAERVRIKTDGKVGIGTTTPAATLDVAGTVKVGTSGSVLNNIIKTSVTITNSTNITTANPLELNVTVTGATVNGTVIVNPRADLTAPIAIGYCYVSAANTVRIVFHTTNGTVQLGSNRVFDITIIQ
jgi:hypothetical protein